MPGIPNWFTEKIRDQVRTRYSSKGGYLDGTMTRGEGGAGTVKFPVVGGRIDMYELSGAIQKVKLSDINLDMLTLLTRDVGFRRRRPCRRRCQGRYRRPAHVGDHHRRRGLRLEDLVGPQGLPLA